MTPQHTLSTVPSDTVKTARAILGRENFYLKVGDNWDSLFAGAPASNSENGAGLQDWLVPTLSIATVLQYKEKLSDRQVEEASRLRVDWKYALHLSIHHPGLSRLMLCKYRQRVYHHITWQREFQSLLDRFSSQGLFDECDEARLRAATLLDEVCSQSRLEEVMLAQRHALEALATKHPKWLRNVIQPNWYARYHLFKATPGLPHRLPEQVIMTETIGADILYLFKAISQSDLPDLGDLEEIKTLQRVWLEQFELSGNGGARRLPRCSFCGSSKTGIEMSR